MSVLLFFLMIRRPPRSTLFPYTSSSDLTPPSAVPHRVHRAAAARRPSPGTPESRRRATRDRKSTRLNSSHQIISYAVFCLKKKKTDAAIRYPLYLHAAHGGLPGADSARV